MRTEELTVIGLYRSINNNITKTSCETIEIDGDGVINDGRHRGDIRGTGGYSRKWSAAVPGEIERIRQNWNQILEERGIQIPLIHSIDPSLLSVNILFSDRIDFSQHFPHFFRFPSGLELYASITNVPCVPAARNILEHLFGQSIEQSVIDQASALFPKYAAKDIRGIVGGVVPDKYGVIRIGDKVTCYS